MKVCWPCRDPARPYKLNIDTVKLKTCCKGPEKFYIEIRLTQAENCGLNDYDVGELYSCQKSVLIIKRMILTFGEILILPPYERKFVMIAPGQAYNTCNVHRRS